MIMSNREQRDTGRGCASQKPEQRKVCRCVSLLGASVHWHMPHAMSDVTFRDMNLCHPVSDVRGAGQVELSPESWERGQGTGVLVPPTCWSAVSLPPKSLQNRRYIYMGAHINLQGLHGTLRMCAKTTVVTGGSKRHHESVIG